MFTLEKVKAENRSVLGGIDTVYTFDVLHESENGYDNWYEVEARVHFIDDFHIELDFFNVTKEPSEDKQNEDTILAEILLDRLNEESQS